MAQMKPAPQNQNQFGSAEGPTFAGFSPAESSFSTDQYFPYVNSNLCYPTHIHYAMRYKLSEANKITSKASKARFWGLIPPSATLTPPKKNLTPQRIVVTQGGIGMKNRRFRLGGRTTAARLWKLAYEVEYLGNDVRYANKPSDLNLSISNLIDLSHSLMIFRDQWLEKWLKSRNESLKDWPKLWERYL